MTRWMLLSIAGSIVVSTSLHAQEHSMALTEYRAFWLTPSDEGIQGSGHERLVLTRGSLAELSNLVSLRNLVAANAADSASPLLDSPAIYWETWNRQCILNVDQKPIKRLETFRLDDDETITIGNKSFRYQAAELGEVLDLLEHPEGLPPAALHRRFAPLGGYEQTARALRLLLLEQLKEDPTSRKSK
jgi:hypothetical protein